MDIKVGLSIYNKPWLIEPNAGLQLLDYWEKMMDQKIPFDYRQFKSESEETEGPSFSELKQKFFALDNTVVAPTNRWDLKSFKGFEGAGVAIIPVSGPLMKADFCGDFGTANLANMHKLASQSASVHTIIKVIDSPGGTVDGTQDFANTVKNSPKNTITLVDGLCASAAYWIGSAAKEMFAIVDTSIIGSIGTMCSWYDKSQYYEQMGIVLREYYATRSTDKNRAFNEANKGLPKMLIQETLNPLNNVFLQSVEAQRAGKIDLAKEDVLTGKTYISNDATSNGLIDGVKTLEEVIGYANDKAKTSKKKTYTMTAVNRFGKALKVANATEFPVVSGGFLVTEEQIEAIDSQLAENETTIRTTTTALGTLQERETAFNEQEARVTAATTAQQTAEANLTTANSRIQELETANAALKTSNDSLDASVKRFMGGKGKQTEDPAQQGEQTEAIDNNASHNKALDKMLGN